MAISQHACNGTEHTRFIFETLAVFQLASFWLKAVALKNVAYMFETFAVFQLERSWLKVDAE